MPINEDGELGEVMHWLGREITEARRAMWEGKSGKAFASLEAAEEEYEKLKKILENYEAENTTHRSTSGDGEK